MDVIDRIQEIIAHEGLTVSSFARRIGVGDQTIRGIVVQRRNNPGYDLILRIIQTFTWLNSEWLITGNGEMSKSICQPTGGVPTVKELVEILKEKDSKIEKLIEEKMYYKLKCEKLSSESSIVK